jgi:hypothetical protein
VVTWCSHAWKLGGRRNPHLTSRELAIDLRLLTEQPGFPVHCRKVRGAWEEQGCLCQLLDGGHHF